jgi:exodeoxyribonuclease V gamma subunit
MMLFQNEELLNSFSEVNVQEPEKNKLLHKIQNDIYNSYAQGERNGIYVTDLQDDSITISSCFTIAREVEVLYNYLVHLVDQKQEALSPREIVVMVTDVTYVICSSAMASYIAAICFLTLSGFCV